MSKAQGNDTRQETPTESIEDIPFKIKPWKSETKELLGTAQEDPWVSEKRTKSKAREWSRAEKDESNSIRVPRLKIYGLTWVWDILKQYGK